MLSVPVEPAFAAIVTVGAGNDAALRNRERAGALIADVQPRTVAPGGARASHPHRTLRACTLADVGGKGGVIDDHPTVRDRQYARAKTADIEPAAGTYCSKWSPGRSPSPYRSSRQTVRRSRRRHCSPHRRFGWSACPCRSRRPRRVPMFVHVEPAPDTITVPCEPGKVPTNRPKSVNVPPFWITSIPVPI